MTIRGILLDFDGVIATAGQPIPGAAEAIRSLQDAGIPFRILTNTTLAPRRALAEALERYGAAVPADHIITPAAAARRLLLSKGRPRVALAVAPTIVSEFADLDLVPEEADEGADYVVVGDLGDTLTARVLNRAFRQLHSGAELIGLGLSRYWQAADGLRLDAGPLVKALEFASGKQAIIAGKPSHDFFRAGVEALGLDPAAIAMVGDDVMSDIAAAQAVGMVGILVRTGKFQPADLQRGVVPDAVLDSIADLPELLAKLRSS